MPAVLAILVLLDVRLGAQGQEIKRSTMYFLPRADGDWCGYRSKDEWRAQAGKTVWPMMGYVEQAGQGREINIRQQDSTADWIVEDKYTVDAVGRIAQLNRTIFYFSDDERKETIYRIQGGRAILMHNAAFSLKTGAPLKLPLPMDEYESWKIYTRAEDFPFNQLLRESGKVANTGVYCTTEAAH